MQIPNYNFTVPLGYVKKEFFCYLFFLLFIFILLFIIESGTIHAIQTKGQMFNPLVSVNRSSEQQRKRSNLQA